MTTPADKVVHDDGWGSPPGAGTKRVSSDGPRGSSPVLPYYGPAGFLWVTMFAFATYGLPLVLGVGMDPQAVGLLVAAFVVLFSVGFFVLEPRLYLIYWFSLVLVQNVSAGLWWSGGAGDIPLLVTEGKTISLLVGLLLMSRSIVELIWTNKLLVVALALYLFGILWNVDVLDVAALANLRNFLTPFAVLLLAASFAQKYTKEQRSHFIVIMLAITTFWLAVGSVGEVLLGTAAWRTMFSADALGSLNSLSEQTTLLGMELARIGGIMIEPTTTGYLAASVITVLLLQRYYQERRAAQIVFVLTLAAAMLAWVLSSTKNPILMFAVGFAAAVALRYLNWRPWAVMIASWVAGFVATLLYIVIATGPGYLTTVWSDPLGSIGGDSSSVHMAGLVAGFASLASEPLGHGLGSGGNFLKIADSNFTWGDWLLSGGESSWGTLAYQLGASALVGFALAMIALANRWGSSATILLGVWSSAALFAEAFFGPIVSSILLFSVGFVADLPRSRSTDDRDLFP